jgi:hypothetical protein
LTVSNPWPKSTAASNPGLTSTGRNARAGVINHSIPIVARMHVPPLYARSIKWVSVYNVLHSQVRLLARIIHALQARYLLNAASAQGT